jgi:dihydroorotate dehydrogenase (NAD+) catalytic subunit
VRDIVAFANHHSARSDLDIAQAAYRLDRSYSWNYAHAPAVPRVRRLPSGPGGKFFDQPLNSSVGVSAGPLLNSKWVEAYARLGFDILTYKTVRSSAVPAYALPNIRAVENRDQVAITTRRAPLNGGLTIAVSMGMPSMEPDVWRKDVRRAKDRIADGQVLVVSVAGTPAPGGDAESLIVDYARCAAWAADSGADAVELHFACPDPFAEQPQLIYENIPLAAQILHRTRTRVGIPVLAKLGVFRSPRLLHETATKLAPWASGFVLVHGIQRRVVDETGNSAFEGRDRATIVGADTFAVSSRQIAEMLSWRKAGAWDRPILAVGGITTVERAAALLREGADAALVATAALFDPLFAVRFRQARATAVA